MRILAALVLSMPLLCSPAGAESAGHAETPANPAETYCLNITDQAADARLARQTRRLEELEAQVGERIALLEKRRDEAKQWVERQESLLKAAEASLVEIYAKMDPEAAAGQLATLDPRLAASVLHQLKPREASAILNVMKTDRAADLVRMLASVTRSAAKDVTP